MIDYFSYLQGKQSGLAEGPLDTSDATATADSLIYGDIAYTVGNTKLIGTGAYWQTVKHGSYIFKGASLLPTTIIYAPNMIDATQMFMESTGCTTLKITMSDNITSLYEFGRSASFVNLYIYSNTSKVSDWNYFLGQNSIVKHIRTPLDLSAATGVISAGDYLETFLVIPNTIKRNLSLQYTPTFSATSLISIANGLSSNAATKNLTMHQTARNNLSTYRVDNNDGVAVLGTTMSISTFISTIKGWTIL